MVGERYLNRILRNVVAMECLAEGAGCNSKTQGSVPSTTITSRVLSIRVRSVVRVSRRTL
jgi:hypothetical protein